MIIYVFLLLNASPSTENSVICFLPMPLVSRVARIGTTEEREEDEVRIPMRIRTTRTRRTQHQQQCSRKKKKEIISATRNEENLLSQFFFQIVFICETGGGDYGIVVVGHSSHAICFFFCQMFKYLRRTSDEVFLIDENRSIKDEKSEDVEQEERWKVLRWVVDVD